VGEKTLDQSSMVMGTQRRARIFLIDDHILVMESYKKLLESHHDMVGEAHETIDVISQIQQVQPDVILMDISSKCEDVMSYNKNHFCLHAPGADFHYGSLSCRRRRICA
jgi:AmiR/NasT family two-component response regulator